MRAEDRGIPGRTIVYCLKTIARHASSARTLQSYQSGHGVVMVFYSLRHQSCQTDNFAQCGQKMRTWPLFSNNKLLFFLELSFFLEDLLSFSFCTLLCGSLFVRSCFQKISCLLIESSSGPTIMEVCHVLNQTSAIMFALACSKQHQTKNLISHLDITFQALSKNNCFSFDKILTTSDQKV